MRSKGRSIIFAALIVLFPVCFIWQGIDVTDTGYALANYQAFAGGKLIEPAAAAIWLTCAMGGGWYALTGHCGLLGFRALYLVVCYCTVGLSLIPLAQLELRRSLPAAFAGAALVIASSAFLPSYNEFTVLFFLSSVVALFYGLVKRRLMLVFTAGAVGGISIFARLPNLVILAIVLAIAFWRGLEFSKGRVSLAAGLRHAASEVSVFVLGYLAGMSIVFLWLVASGDFSAYVSTVGQLFGMLGDSNQHHGGGRLLRGLLHDYFYAGVVGIGALAIGTGIGWVAGRSRSASIRVALVLGVSSVLIALLYWTDTLEVYFWPGIIYTVLLLGAFGFLHLLDEHRLLCVMAGLLLLLTPLGSNNGIYNVIYGMYFAVPVALMALIANRLNSDRDSLVAYEERPSSILGGFFRKAQVAASRVDTATVAQTILITMIGWAVLHRWTFTYRDSHDRMAMRTAIAHPKLRGIYTTADRAGSLQGLLQALRPLVRKGDALMDHMQLPLIYFLTETRPYLRSSWANLYEPPAFKASLERALADERDLPVFVRTKVDTCHPNWPVETYKPWLTDRFVENQRAVETFLAAQNYEKHWENNAFEIWLPPAHKL
jgi:hypothetical protein